MRATSTRLLRALSDTVRRPPSNRCFCGGACLSLPTTRVAYACAWMDGWMDGWMCVGQCAPTGTVDMRIEVGLLSRNVIIQGDDKSASQKFGAHTLAVHGGVFHMENAGAYTTLCVVPLCGSRRLSASHRIVWNACLERCDPQRSAIVARASCLDVTATICTWLATKLTRTSVATVSTTASSVQSPSTVLTTRLLRTTSPMTSW